MPSSPERAVELRLGKIGRSLAQYLIRLAKLPVLTFQSLQAGPFLARRPVAKTLVALGLPNPWTYPEKVEGLLID